MIKKYGGPVAIIAFSIAIVIAVASGLITSSFFEPVTAIVATGIGYVLLLMDFKIYERMAQSDPAARKKLYYRDMTIRALSEVVLLIALGVAGGYLFPDHVLACLLIEFVGFFIPRLSYRFARKWVHKNEETPR